MVGELGLCRTTKIKRRISFGSCTRNIALLISSHLCFTLWYALPKPLPGIPYNPISARRILGDAPDLFKWKAKHGDLYAYLAQLAVELNSPIFQVFMRPLGRPWVVVMDHREAHDIMTRRTKEFDRSKFFGQAFMALLPKHHVSMPTGDEWHAHRRLVSDTVS